MIESRKLLRMRNIYDQCRKQDIPVSMKFIYRRDYSFVANLWNLYSYRRFWLEITIFKYNQELSCILIEGMVYSRVLQYNKQAKENTF